MKIRRTGNYYMRLNCLIQILLFYYLLILKLQDKTSETTALKLFGLFSNIFGSLKLLTYFFLKY